MRIRENTNNRLVVIDFHWKIGAIFVASGLFMVFKLIQGDPQLNGENFYGGLVSIVFCLTGGLFFIWIKSFIFDRTTNTFTWQQKRITGFKSGTVHFSEIRSLALQTRTVGSHSTLGYRVALTKKDGEEIPFSPAYSAGEKDNCEQTIKIIQGFLSVEISNTEQIGRTSVEEMVAKGDLINAMKYLQELEDINLTEAKRQVDKIREEQLRNAPMTQENFEEKQELAKSREQLIAEGKLVKAINLIMQEDGVSRSKARGIIKEIKKRM